VVGVPASDDRYGGRRSSRCSWLRDPHVDRDSQAAGVELMKAMSFQRSGNPAMRPRLRLDSRFRGMTVSWCLAVAAQRRKGRNRPPGVYSDDGPPTTFRHLADIPTRAARRAVPSLCQPSIFVFGRTYVPVVNKDATRERASHPVREEIPARRLLGRALRHVRDERGTSTLPIPSYARVHHLKEIVMVAIDPRRS